MEKIRGIVSSNWNLMLTEVVDFLYYDGPFLTLFEDTKNPGDYYFYKWADFDASVHRWIVSPISKKNLIAYLKKGITLRDLLMGSGYIYLIDLDADINPVSVVFSSPKWLPEDYLPMENSWCDLQYFTT